MRNVTPWSDSFPLTQIWRWDESQLWNCAPVPHGVFLGLILRHCTATWAWWPMGVVPILAGALCLCDWIISSTCLVSSGYLFFICKYLPEHLEHINIPKVETWFRNQDLSCGCTTITTYLRQNKNQTKNPPKKRKNKTTQVRGKKKPKKRFRLAHPKKFIQAKAPWKDGRSLRWRFEVSVCWCRNVSY